MVTSLIAVTESPGVVRLTLNRPDKRNALTREMLAELTHALDAATLRSDLRLLVISGAGSAFCAGMDLAQMQETAQHADAEALWKQDADLYLAAVRTIFSCRCPTLAVVPGPAYAGGLGLVLACDLVLAAESATFALPEPKRGITAAIVTPLLVHRVGPSAASWLLFSGEAIDTERARQIGLCHRGVPADRLAEAEGGLIQSLLTGAPGALETTKRQLRAGFGETVLAQLEQAALVSAHARQTPEAREGLQAFLEKRPPTWTVVASESGVRRAE